MTGTDNLRSVPQGIGVIGVVAMRGLGGPGDGILDGDLLVGVRQHLDDRHLFYVCRVETQMLMVSDNDNCDFDTNIRMSPNF